MPKTLTKTAAKNIMPIISVASVDELRNFYVDTLGFQHVMGVIGKDGQLDFVTLVRDGARLMFTRTRGTEEKRTNGARPVEMYVEVEDVDRFHDEVKKKKVRIADPLTTQWWGDRTFKILDPAGYVLWFFETVGEPKPPQGTKIV
ncbi:MAG TPA: glyoxalase superfamily protein [Thermoanaerobaculia bacterium]